MTVPTRTPLGESTLVRKWYLDINTGTDAAPNWIGVFGIVNFQPTQDTTLQDDSDYDSNGFKSSTATAIGWGATLTVSRKVQVDAPTAYDPGQEVLRLASADLGVGNSVEVRYYEMTPGGPRVEAYQGRCAVSWAPSGGAMDALDQVQVTLTGQGQRTAITHPDSGSLIPEIVSLSPTSTGVAGGGAIRINGSGFTGATQVEVNGTAIPAADFTIVSDALIVFTAPAEAAGTYPVVVVNANGTSNPENLTYA